MSDNILADIQQKLHAPKGQKNDFGGFQYRSAEDILAAVKPILAEHGQSLQLVDNIVQIGDRYYVQAKAILHPCERQGIAYAREQEDKKGMDQAQVTGSASSYARKYALAGLFAIDNEKDPDTADNRKEGTPKRINRKLAQRYIKSLEPMIEDEDGTGIRQLNDELKENEDLHKFVWDYFSTEQKSKAKELLHQARDAS